MNIQCIIITFEYTFTEVLDIKKNDGMSWGGVVCVCVGGGSSFGIHWVSTSLEKVTQNEFYLKIKIFKRNNKKLTVLFLHFVTKTNLSLWIKC